MLDVSASDLMPFPHVLAACASQNNTTMFWRVLLTIFGLKGGVTRRFSRASQSMGLKNGWSLMPCSPVPEHPNLLLGSFVINWHKHNKKPS